MTGNQKKRADTSTHDKMRICLFGCKNMTSMLDMQRQTSAAVKSERAINQESE